MAFLSSLTNVLVMILGFGLLIFVHELGHFLAAKWAGIRTDAFAIGMGPTIASWRRGVGFASGSTTPKVVKRTGKQPAELTDPELKRFGVDETEYSLRWLPIGGFVRMLGQDDVNPAAVSEDPRSYGRCPVGRRMIVVSAGVVMNLLLAAVLYIIAFMLGVTFPAPVVGQVLADSPAAAALADEASGLEDLEPGLQPGDVVLSIDGRATQTFADLKIASAMSRPGQPLSLVIRRSGFAEPLAFRVLPEKDIHSGLLSIGIAPASSTTLVDRDEDDIAATVLEKSQLLQAGVELGMTLLTVDGEPVEALEQLQGFVESSQGQPLATVWSRLEDGQPTGPMVEAPLAVHPSYEVMRYADSDEQRRQDFDEGLFGLSPLVRIAEVNPGPNADVLRTGDVIVRIGDVDAPRLAQFKREITRHTGRPVQLIIQRDGQEQTVTAKVSRKGLLGVITELAWDLPITAAPMTLARDDQGDARPTAAADLELPGHTRLLAVGTEPVSDWSQLRRALLVATSDAGAATLPLTVQYPTPGAQRETVAVSLAPHEVAALHELSWRVELAPYIFRPVSTVLDAGGDPIQAMRMGVRETHKVVLLTYLTIDRLFRRSVGVEQLHGPLGIVHMGSKILDGGVPYLLFFLAMISANLAVLNFLPLPIVDGGLFLFLVYEKLKGRPPSIAFQNAATLVGLFMIGTVLLVVTWNDVMRLLQ